MDKKLSSVWGFRPGWAIRAAAMFGDPNSRSTNVVLARTKMAEIRDSEVRFTSKESLVGVLAVVMNRLGPQLELSV